MAPRPPGSAGLTLESLLNDDEQEYLHRVREFMKSEVEPASINIGSGSFPFEIVPGFRQLGWLGCRIRIRLSAGRTSSTAWWRWNSPAPIRRSPRSRGARRTVDGLDLSVRQRRAEATISAGHGSIRQDRAFGLTEPTSGRASGGLTTTARQDGGRGSSTGRRNGSGTTFGDLTVIWAETSPTDG